MREIPLLLALLLVGSPALAGGPDACLVGHLRRQKDGIPHFVSHVKGSAHASAVDIDEPATRVHCTPKGRFAFVDRSGGTGRDWAPDALSVVDPILGRNTLPDGSPNYWITDAYFAPDNRLVAYTTWNGAHGDFSIVTTLRLLDADTDRASVKDADIPLYPAKADTFVGGDADEWAHKWLFKLQPASDVVWQGSRQLSFLLVDNRLDEVGNPSGKPPLYCVATVIVDLPAGEPPVAHLTITSALPLAQNLPNSSTEAYRAALRTCLAHPAAR